jgi:UDP-glucose 4-epimerase
VPLQRGAGPRGPVRGSRHKITGSVHLAGSVPSPPGAQPTVEGARTAVGGLLNVPQAACDWQGGARTSASTSTGSARTPATSPATTPNEQLPTTSPGCASATTASRGLEAINGRLEYLRSSAFGFGNLTCYIAHRF